VNDAEMHLVVSTSIAAIGYDAAASTLFVRFRGRQATYAYARVEQSVFEAFLNSKSKGEYYNAKIRDHYSWHKIRP